MLWYNSLLYYFKNHTGAIGNYIFLLEENFYTQKKVYTKKITINAILTLGNSKKWGLMIILLNLISLV